MRVDGQIYDVTEVPELAKNNKHNIDVVVDRVVIKDGVRSRLFDSMETALKLSDGYVIIDVIDGQELRFNEHFACPHGDFQMGELEPRLFSFNAPFGACPSCDGLGSRLVVDEALAIPDENLTLEEGAFVAWNPISSNYYMSMMRQFCEQEGIPMDVPYKKLKKSQQADLKYGVKDGRSFKFTYTPMSGTGTRTANADRKSVV